MTPTRMRPAEAAAIVEDTDSVGIPLGPGQPPSFLQALGQRERFTDLQISGALLVDFYEVFGRPGVHYRSGFFGPLERLLRDAGHDVQFVPADFRRFAPLLQEIRPRIMSTVVTPPDAEGYCSLSLHAGATVGELHRAGVDPKRVLVAEANPNFPRTFGLPPEHTHSLHVDEIDILVEGDRPPFVISDPEPGDVDRAIAEHCLAFVSDGCTLQTGIGAVPNIVAMLLSKGAGGGYGIHSEMFTNGLMALHEAGKVANRKGVYDGVSITTFAAGSLELYRWLDNNPDVRFLPVHEVNSPEVISRNHRMVSLNGALAVDLAGQAVADTLVGAQYSGIGGHEDFVASSGLELEDRSLICLPSTVTIGGQSMSRIVDRFPSGTIVTTPRHQLDTVITEYGIAELRGRTVRQRARALASISHPDHRDGLLDEAERWPPS